MHKYVWCKHSQILYFFWRLSDVMLNMKWIVDVTYNGLMMCANNGVYYDLMVVLICLHITLPHYDHHADVSEGIELLKCLSGTFLWSVCVRLSQFSQLSFMQYMGLCVFSLPIYLMMIVRIGVLYLIFNIKSEVWPVCHCLWLGNETLVCAVCLSIFLWWCCLWKILIFRSITGQSNCYFDWFFLYF